MAFLGETYNPQEDTGGMLYPPGEFMVRIESTEIKDTKAGDGQYILVTMMGLDGDMAGREIIDRINFNNPNPLAVEIAQRTMGQLAFILQKPLSDNEQLNGLECKLKITVTPPKNGKEAGNNFKYLPRDSGSQGFAPNTAQQSAKPAAASGNAPWKKAAA
jgi:hypothetical protein